MTSIAVLAAPLNVFTAEIAESAEMAHLDSRVASNSCAAMIAPRFARRDISALSAISAVQHIDGATHTGAAG
jgi:hypothetical protein